MNNGPGLGDDVVVCGRGVFAKSPNGFGRVERACVNDDRVDFVDCGANVPHSPGEIDSPRIIWPWHEL